jgi:hypothetical protein
MSPDQFAEKETARGRDRAVVNETEISKLLEEGLRFYAVGDPSRALEAWFKVLEAEPAHPRALEYVEYVRKSYRVENDATALSPIDVGATSEPSDAPPNGESGFVELVVEAPHPETAVVDDAVATVAPTERLDDAAASTVENAGARPAEEAWKVEVHHDAAAPTPSGPHSAAATLESSTAAAPPSSANPAAADAMDWGALVDDAVGVSTLPSAAETMTSTDAVGALSGAPPNALQGDPEGETPAADAPAAQVYPVAAEDPAPMPEALPRTTRSTSDTEAATAAITPLPPAVPLVDQEPKDEPEPALDVVAARWTTEASPAGAQDRADHGGFEDGPLPEFSEWPMSPGGFGQQIRAGSAAVVEIPDGHHGRVQTGHDAVDAGPPPPAVDSDGVDHTPPSEHIPNGGASENPSVGASSGPVDATSAQALTATETDPAVKPAHSSADDPPPNREAGVDPAEPENASSSMGDSAALTHTDASTHAPMGDSDATSVAVADPSSRPPGDASAEPRPAPATLLETSWGDLIDDDLTDAARSTEPSVSTSKTSKASTAPRAPDELPAEAESASPPVDDTPLPPMHLMPLDDRTPRSTRIANTEDGGPPPPNPNELQSDDGSAPVIRMDGPPDAAPLRSGHDADVLTFPNLRSAPLAREDDDGAASERAPPLAPALNLAGADPAAEHSFDAGPQPSIEMTSTESKTPPTATQADGGTASTNEQSAIETDAVLEQTTEASSSEEPALHTGAREREATLPAGQFRAIAVDDTASEPFFGVHRTSKVSDSSIVVNPAEEAKRIGVTEQAPRPAKHTAVAQERSARVLRFDSYEGDAAESSEGLAVATVTTTATQSSSSSRPDLESDDTIRAVRPPTFKPSGHEPTQVAAGDSPSTEDSAVPDASTVAFNAVPTTGPDGKPASPWDAFSGESDSVDLDATTSRSVFDDLMSDEDREARTRSSSSNGGASALETFGAIPAAIESAGGASASDTEPVNQCAALMEGARELFALGDFSGSLELVEKVLKLEPENLEATGYLQKNEGTLLQMYASKLGDLRLAPRLLTKPDEVIWMNLHHRAGFLLSQVDGLMTYEDLVEISGMSRLETYRILADLVQNGVITS